MSFDPQARVTHRSVLAVAVPIMLSNVLEPMIGVAARLDLILLSPIIREVGFSLVCGSAGIRQHGEIYSNHCIWSAP